MKRFVVSTLLMVSCSFFAEAAKLYKIVDEKGNVTFSQYPPKDNKAAAKVEDVSVSVNQAATQVTRDGRNQRCGNIRLPSTSSSRYDQQHMQQKLARELDDWEQEIIRVSDRIDEMSRQKFNRSHNKNSYQNSSYQKYHRNNDQYYQQKLADNTERLRDLRCAVKWSKASLSGIPDSAGASRSQEVERLTAIKQELQDTLDRVCGQLPLYDPTDQVAEAKRKEWYKCSSDYRKKISTVERKIKQL